MKVVLILMCLLLSNQIGTMETATYNVSELRVDNPYDNPGVDCSFTIVNSNKMISYLIHDQTTNITMVRGFLGSNRTYRCMGLSQHNMFVVIYDLTGVELVRYQFKAGVKRNYILNVP